MSYQVLKVDVNEPVLSRLSEMRSDHSGIILLTGKHLSDRERRVDVPITAHQVRFGARKSDLDPRSHRVPFLDHLFGGSSGRQEGPIQRGDFRPSKNIRTEVFYVFVNRCNG